METGTLSRPPVNLCANPPPGRLPCAAPCGTVSLYFGKGWGLTPPFRYPDPSPLTTQSTGTREGGRGGATAFVEGAFGPARRWWEWRGLVGSQHCRPTHAVWGSAGYCSRQPNFFTGRGIPARGALVGGGGPQSPPLPAQNSGSLPAVSWGEGDHNHPLPTQAAAGHEGDVIGKGEPSSPLPSEQPRAAAPEGPQGPPGGITSPT